jgi:hypothetical protein
MSDFILLEDGTSKLLKEDGTDRLILESFTGAVVNVFRRTLSLFGARVGSRQGQ